MNFKYYDVLSTLISGVVLLFVLISVPLKSGPVKY